MSALDVNEQGPIIKKFLMELQNPSTTPEMALQSLLYSCLSPTNCFPISDRLGATDNSLCAIFVAYIRFIVKKLPDACVDGIWKDILRKTVIYSRYFPPVVGNCSLMSAWLDKALNNKSNCPNPYIRLE
ncbi:unnamed protein product, partial [Meganyctiphanes norvegica]